MKKPPVPPYPANGTLAEKNDWLGARIADAERWLRSLHPWHRAWLEWKWFHIDPTICKIRCWLKGEICPWEEWPEDRTR